jgi:hypothetical protein
MELLRCGLAELTFSVSDVAALPYAAMPTIGVRLHLKNAHPARPVHTVSLNCQVQIETLGRAYTAAEESKLLDLFGERERWARTMKPMLWTNAVVKVPGFTDETTVELALPCSMDFDVAANKYFYGLDQGWIQVAVMFSGTVFYAGEDGAMQVAQVPWDREVRFKIPVEVWQQAVEQHYPGQVWTRLSKETFDRLYRYRVARGIPTWESMIEKLLDGAELAEVKDTVAVSVGGVR